MGNATLGLIQTLLLVVVSLGIGGLIGDKFRGQKRVGTLLGFFGPIGWLLVLLVDDKRQRCPECRSPLIHGARRCAKCGAQILAASAR